jgi:hypothetical protein
MPLTPIIYQGNDRETFDSYNSLRDDQKNGGVWESTDQPIINIRKAIKDYYIIAQDYTCPYCRQRMEVNHNAAWDAEHIIPKKTHPQFIFEPLNLCVSCKDCNNEKRDKSVLENNQRKTFPNRCEDYTIVHPHFDDFFEHIRVIETAAYYLPLSDKGRRTIEKCGLLRFTYKFSNYGNTSTENKETILKLANTLQEATSPQEENAYLSIIADAVQEGQKLSKKTILENVVARNI